MPLVCAAALWLGASTEGTDEIAAAARRVLADPEAVTGPRSLYVPQAPPEIRQAAQTTAAAALGAISSPDNAPSAERRRYRLFISQSMPAADIQAAIGMARSHRSDLVLVLRGLAPEQPLAQIIRWIVELGAQELAVQIDPPAFVAAGIDAVPALARYAADGSLEAVAFGVIDPAFVDRYVARGERGELGQFGEVVEIEEVDLMQAMQARAADADWAGMRARATARYWHRQAQRQLPPAPRPRPRLLDPTFEVTETITAIDGQVIALAGPRVTPLDHAPFGQRLVVFDPRIKGQIELVQPYLTRTDRNLTLIAVGAESLQHISDWSEQLGQPVRLLNQGLVERFAIRFVPTIVEAQGDRFVVRELASDG